MRRINFSLLFSSLNSLNNEIIINLNQVLRLLWEELVMKLLKHVRKFLIELVMIRLGLSEDNFSVVDIIEDDSSPEDILPAVENWLDENRPGINRRWDDVGYQLWDEANHFKSSLEEEYDKLGDRDE